MKINISDITGTQTPINSDNIDTSCENMSGLKIGNIYYSASANPETNSIDVNSGLYINSIDCSILNSLKNNRYCPYRIDVNNGNITLTEEGNGYINIYDENGIIQFYANYSSPDSDELNEEYKSYVFAIKHDEELILPEYDNAYIYYNNYSYTYTESIRPLDTDDSFKYNIYAYDYFITINNLNQNINVNTQPFEHACDNNYNDKIFVNEKSDTSYILKLGNGSSVITRSDNIIPEEESSNNNIRKFKLSNIIEKSQQIDSTCLNDKSTEYYVAVSYSYLCKNEDNEYDGILHTDGLQYLSGSNNRYGVHVWGLEDPDLISISFKAENRDTQGHIQNNQNINDDASTGIGQHITQSRFHFNATNNLKNIISNNFNSYFNFRCNISYLTNEIDDNTYVQSNITTLPMNYSVSNNHVISIDSFINNNATQSNSLLTLFKILYGNNYDINMILKPLSRNNYGQITFNYNIEGLHNVDKVQYANEINKNAINKKVCIRQLPMSIVDKELELDIELSVYDLLYKLYRKTQYNDPDLNTEFGYDKRVLLNYIDLRFIPTKSDNDGDYNTSDNANINTNDNINPNTDNSVSRVFINIPTIFNLNEETIDGNKVNRNYISIDTSKINIAVKAPRMFNTNENEDLYINQQILDGIVMQITGPAVSSLSDFGINNNIPYRSVSSFTPGIDFLGRKEFNIDDSNPQQHYYYSSWITHIHNEDHGVRPILIFDSSTASDSNLRPTDPVKIHMKLIFKDEFINTCKYEFVEVYVNKSEVFDGHDRTEQSGEHGEFKKSSLEGFNNQNLVINNYYERYNTGGDFDTRYYNERNNYNNNGKNVVSGFYPDYFCGNEWDKRYENFSKAEILRTDHYYFGLYKSGNINQNVIHRGLHNIKLFVGYPSYNNLNPNSQGNTSGDDSGGYSDDDPNDGNTNENNNENIENNFTLSYRQNNSNNDITAIQNNHQEYYVGNFILRNNTSVNINGVSISSIKITNNTGIIRTLNLEDNSKVVINNYNTTTQELLISILYYSTDTSMTVTYEYVHDDISATEIDNINLLFS